MSVDKCFMQVSFPPSLQASAGALVLSVKRTQQLAQKYQQIPNLEAFKGYL